jgi:hypothetical protein
MAEDYAAVFMANILHSAIPQETSEQLCGTNLNSKMMNIENKKHKFIITYVEHQMLLRITARRFFNTESNIELSNIYDVSSHFRKSAGDIGARIVRIFSSTAGMRRALAQSFTYTTHTSQAVMMQALGDKSNIKQ